MKKLARNARLLVPVLCLFLAAGSAASAAPAAQPSLGVTMYETVERAFAYNPDLKAAQEARWGKLHDIDRAMAGHYPKVGLFSGVGFSQRSDPVSRAANTARP